MTFVIILFFWIVSLCLHEFSHALVAYKGGDYTVKEKGYLTFNPALYMDPFSSLILPAIFLMMGGIPLPGGAVYIRTDLLRSKAWDSAVSAAGPLSNILLTLLLAIPFWLGLAEETPFWNGYAFFLWIQVAVIFLNLLPIPPLDGWGIISPWMSMDVQRKARKLGFYPILFLFLILMGSPKINHAFFFSIDWVTHLLSVSGDMIDAGQKQFDILKRFS